MEKKNAFFRKKEQREIQQMRKTKEIIEKSRQHSRGRHFPQIYLHGISYSETWSDKHQSKVHLSLSKLRNIHIIVLYWNWLQLLKFCIS